MKIYEGNLVAEGARIGVVLSLIHIWGLKVLTIQALQDYCRRHDKHVVREASAHLPTKYGDFQIYGLSLIHI